MSQIEGVLAYVFESTSVCRGTAVALSRRMRTQPFIVLSVLSLATAAEAGVSYSPYQGFVIQVAQQGAPDGQISQCMQPGPERGSPYPSIDLVQCSTNSPDVVIAPSTSQITIAGQCLSISDQGDIGLILDLEPCGSGPQQVWSFKGGVIENPWSQYCLYALRDSVSLGGCAATNATAASGYVSTNLFMPINYSMAILSESLYCLTDLKQNYNSDNADTQIRNCAQTGTWPTSRPDQLWTAKFMLDSSAQGFSLYNMTSNSDGEALDVYANQFSQGVGTVDMADPRSPPLTTLGQHWYFNASGDGSPNGFSLIQHGTGGECLDIHGGEQLRASIDAFSCNSQYGNGSNPAQQWQAVIPGFAH